MMIGDVHEYPSLSRRPPFDWFEGIDVGFSPTGTNNQQPIPESEAIYSTNVDEDTRTPQHRIRKLHCYSSCSSSELSSAEPPANPRSELCWGNDGAHQDTPEATQDRSHRDAATQTEETRVSFLVLVWVAMAAIAARTSRSARSATFRRSIRILTEWLLVMAFCWYLVAQGEDGSVVHDRVRPARPPNTCPVLAEAFVEFHNCHKSLDRVWEATRIVVEPKGGTSTEVLDSHIPRSTLHVDLGFLTDLASPCQMFLLLLYVVAGFACLSGPFKF